MQLAAGHIQAHISHNISLDIRIGIQLSIIWSILIMALAKMSDRFVAAVILNEWITLSWLFIVRGLLYTGFDNFLLFSMQA